MEPYLMTKLRNRVKRQNDGSFPIVFDLHNESVNGRKLGCFGYIVNEKNGRSVYVNTDEVCGGGYAPLAGKAMVRYEGDPKYTSRKADIEHYGNLYQQNQWVDAERLPWAIYEMLTAPVLVNAEFECSKSRYAA